MVGATQRILPASQPDVGAEREHVGVGVFEEEVFGGREPKGFQPPTSVAVKVDVTVGGAPGGRKRNGSVKLE